MKIRTKTFLIITIMVLGLCGCNNISEGATETNSEASLEASSEATDNQVIESETAVIEDDNPSDWVSETESDIVTSNNEGELEMSNTDANNKELTITFIGHGSLEIKTSEGKVIFIDPNYPDYDYADVADIVLVTHSHYDHQPCEAVKITEDTTLITYKEALHNGIYEKYEIDGIIIEAVPAGGNPNHDVNSCVGYLVTADGYTIYHAGDTSKLDSMTELASRNIDYAFYPIDGVFNMNAKEATIVADMVQAKNSIPIHALDDNNTGKANEFTPTGRLIINTGESIVVEAK